MSTAALVTDLQARGVRLSAVNGRLRVEAPKGLLTPEVKQALAERKGEVLAYLTAWPGPCYACGETAWWLGTDTGVIVCGRCHPPMFTHHVAAWVPQSARTWPRQ
ncbi:MAG: hypothetical protein V2A77_02650 [Pseudomonadota bacterium]